MLKIKNKIIIGASGILVAGAPLAMAVSCGKKASNTWNDSKTIVLAIDDKNKPIYEKAVEQWRKLDESKGYKIKWVTKDLMGHMDMVKTIGFTDDNVGDIFYMPYDKIADQLEDKTIMPWKKEEAKSFLDGIEGIKDKEVTSMLAKGFGTVDGKSYQFVFPHNKEAIVMYSKSDLSSNTDTIEQMIENAGVKDQTNGGFFKLNDFWYAMGLLGSYLNDEKEDGLTEAMKSIITKKDSNWISGFIESGKTGAASSEVRAKFIALIDQMSGMWYDYYQKAYLDGDWDKNSGTPNSKHPNAGNFKKLLNVDGGAAQTASFDLIKDGQGSAIMGGTWDANVMAKQGMNHIKVIPKITGNKNFIQAPGGWVFGINARNNGASTSRKKAVVSLMKQFYTKGVSSKYASIDGKIPYVASLAKEVKKGEKENITSGITSLMDKVNTDYKTQTSSTTNIITGNAPNNAAKYEEEIEKANGDWRHFKTWLDSSANEIQKFKDAFKDLQNSKVSDWNIASKTINELRPDAINTIAIADGTNKISGVTNVLGKIIGEPSPLSSHLIGMDKFKPDANFPTGFKTNAGQLGDTLHIRAVMFAGLNDIWAKKQKNEDSDFKQWVLKDKVWDQNHANEISSKMSTWLKNNMITHKSLVDIKDLVKEYLNVYKFKHALDSPIVKAKKTKLDLLENTKVKINDIDLTLTNSQLLKMHKDILAGSILTKLIESLNELRTMPKRPDNNNPQFSSVWGQWDAQTFGNSNLIQSIYSGSSGETIVKTEDEFKARMRKQLSSRFEGLVKVLDAGNASNKT